MKIELKGSLIPDRETLHDHLQNLMQLPIYYGRNLDALYDLLTERMETTEILITEWEVMEVNLGHYAAALLDTLYDAARENPSIHVQVK